MDSFTTSTGLTSVFTGDNVAHGQPGLWRPWTGKTERKRDAHKAHSMHEDLSAGNNSKIPQFVHPVKLYWPKSRCFDYLFQDAEMLLRNYPVQATISLYEDSSSEEDSEDEEEEVEKELN